MHNQEQTDVTCRFCDSGRWQPLQLPQCLLSSRPCGVRQRGMLRHMVMRRHSPLSYRLHGHHRQQDARAVPGRAQSRPAPRRGQSKRRGSTRGRMGNGMRSVDGTQGGSTAQEQRTRDQEKLARQTMCGNHTAPHTSMPVRSFGNTQPASPKPAPSRPSQPPSILRTPLPTPDLQGAERLGIFKQVVCSHVNSSKLKDSGRIHGRRNPAFGRPVTTSHAGMARRAQASSELQRFFGVLGRKVRQVYPRIIIWLHKCAQHVDQLQLQRSECRRRWNCAHMLVGAMHRVVTVRVLFGCADRPLRLAHIVRCGSTLSPKQERASTPRFGS